MLQHKKILVLGGTGHLGAALVHYLVQQVNILPSNIRVFYLKGSPRDALADIEGLDFFEGNILNKKEVEAACADRQIVFHSIGSTTFDPQLKKLQWLINVEGTRHVLDAVRLSTAFEKLCYVSTVNVLAPPALGTLGSIDTSDPYTSSSRIHSFTSAQAALDFAEQVRTSTDDTWVNKLDIGYYDSKLAAQELVNHYVKQYGLNVVSILPGTMFGPYDHLIGNGMYLISIYHGQMPVTMSAGLPLTHVMDVAAGMVQAIERGTKGSRYILSGRVEDNLSLKQLGTIVAEELTTFFPQRKFSGPRLELPYFIVYLFAWLYEHIALLLDRSPLVNTQAVRAGHHHWYFEHDRSSEEIGYKPQFTFRQAVKDMIAYYDKHQLFQVRERYIDKR
jgi:dihydroflavonol-4-reductase